MISVVIPAYNEEKNIGRTLDSLVAQTTTQDYEVIVVDNASTDKTPEIVNKYKDKLNLKLVEEPNKGRGQARFTGFRVAQGDIILSTDSDTVVPPDWIDKIASYFNDPNIAAVTGTCIINDCSWRINKSFNIFQPTAMVAYRLVFQHYWLSGFNFAIRADVYKKAGEFNPHINMQEDTDLAIRVKNHGKIKFVRDIPVIFSGRRFQKGLIRGATPYVTSYINYFFLKKSPYLSDIR